MCNIKQKFTALSQCLYYNITEIFQIWSEVTRRISCDVWMGTTIHSLFRRLSHVRETV
jgi:hypothetical protein